MKVYTTEHQPTPDYPAHGVRHCSAENVEVYEATAPTLAEALRNIADFVESDEDDGWFNLSLGTDPDDASPVVMLYRHA